MSELDKAILKHISHIVLEEHRLFSYQDFLRFIVDEKEYHIVHGTFRNKISKLMKDGRVEMVYNSGIAFYTLKGITTPKPMTPDHTGVPSSIIDDSILKQTPIYKWIKNRTFDKQALHNIRLTFEASRIWGIFSKVYPDLIEHNSQDIRLQPLTFFDYIDVIMTIHHTNTVSVAVSYSHKPIAVDAKDIMHLSEALTRTEVHIANIIGDYCKTSNILPSTIPSYRKWIVKMWHFGVDSIDKYSGKEFHVTFEEGVTDLIRIYTKRMEGNNNKQKVRIERQEYPNQEVADAFIKKLFPDGRLINTDEFCSHRK